MKTILKTELSIKNISTTLFTNNVGRSGVGVARPPRAPDEKWRLCLEVKGRCINMAKYTYDQVVSDLRDQGASLCVTEHLVIIFNDLSQ